MTLPLNLNQLFTNNAVSLLATGISSTATSLTVIPGHGALYPQPIGDGSDYFLITLEDQAATIREVIKVNSRVNDTLFFTLADRGLEGTTPLSWSASLGNDTLVDHRVTAETMQRAMRLPVGGSSWIYGENTTNTNINSGLQIPISIARYSNNRTFKFIVTITQSVSKISRAFEVLVVVSGDLAANAEVVHATQYATVGPQILGDLHAIVNTSTKILQLEWLNNELAPVIAHVTKVQQFPVL